MQMAVSDTENKLFTPQRLMYISEAASAAGRRRQGQVSPQLFCCKPHNWLYKMLINPPAIVWSRYSCTPGELEVQVEE